VFFTALPGLRYYQILTDVLRGVNSTLFPQSCPVVRGDQYLPETFAQLAGADVDQTVLEENVSALSRPPIEIILEVVEQKESTQSRSGFLSGSLMEENGEPAVRLVGAPSYETIFCSTQAVSNIVEPREIYPPDGVQASGPIECVASGLSIDDMGQSSFPPPPPPFVPVPQVLPMIDLERSVKTGLGLRQAVEIDDPFSGLEVFIMPTVVSASGTHGATENHM